MTTFKSQGSGDATEALQDLRLDGGANDSDEYDFMDDAEDSEDRAAQRAAATPGKYGYQRMLQEIADRTRNHIYIDLDDLDQASAQLKRLTLNTQLTQRTV